MNEPRWVRILKRSIPASWQTIPLAGAPFRPFANDSARWCHHPFQNDEDRSPRRQRPVNWRKLRSSGASADGRLYFTSEQGEVRVVKAGPAFELLAVNEMDDVCMATPAICAGALFVRSQHYLWSLGWK